VVDDCTLSAGGLAAQLGRFERLATHVVELRRLPDAVELAFGPGLDEALLREVVEVERECCPFFAINVGEHGRLRIGVEDRSRRPALEALADALTPRGG